MKKLIDLREYLLRQVSQLTTNPDQLLTYIENGRIAFSPGNNFSHRYFFKAVIVVTDWHAEADTIIIPILEWLSVREPGFNQETALTFEADILSREAIDLIIKLDLTERVIVKDENNQRTVTHVLPPPPLQIDKGVNLEFFVSGPLGAMHLPEQE